MKPKRPISVGQMAKSAGFSRQRFYDLIKKGIFPEPVRSGARPMFTPDQQAAVLGVIETGVGVNGEYVLFNAKPKKSKPETSSVGEDLQPIVESLAALGLTATRKQVGEAIKDLGISDVDSPDSIKAIFLHLKS